MKINTIKELYEKAVSRHMENSPICVLNDYGERFKTVDITMDTNTTLINGKKDKFVIFWINDDNKE